MVDIFLPLSVSVSEVERVKTELRKRGFKVFEINQTVLRSDVPPKTLMYLKSHLHLPIQSISNLEVKDGNRQRV